MSQTLPKIIADFNTTITASVTVGDTTFTLTSATDDDGVALPTGTYGLTIDRKNSNKEYIQCTITGTSVTNVKNVSRQGTLTTGFARKHRKGAEVIISDFSVLKKMLDLLDGTTDFDSATILSYDGNPSFTPGSNEIATIKYADDLAIAGSPDATTSTKGITKMSVAPVSAASPIAVGDNDYRLNPNNYAADAGSNDTYVITLTNAPASYVTGQKFVFKANTANTGTATLNVNSLGAKTIVRSDGTTLLTGDILANQIVEVVYNGTNLVMTSAPASTVNLVSSAYPAGDGSAITGVTGALTETYPLGESFTGATTPQPAVIISDIKISAPIRELGIGTTRVDFGRSGGGSPESCALKIIPRGTITADTVKARIIKVNSPTNNVLIEIQTDSAGSPSGTPIANGTSVAQAGSGFTNADIRTFTFSSPFTLSSGTTYWVVIKVNSLDSTNWYRVQSLSAANDTYASFSAKSYTSSTWSACPLPVIEIVPTAANTGSTSSLWIADANATSARLRNVDGLVTTTGSAGATGTIQRIGRVAGFTGLTLGATYYLSTTAGAITASLEDIGGVAIGKAYSATQIDLFNNIKVVGDTIVVGSAGTYFLNVDCFVTAYFTGGSGSVSISSDTSSTPTTLVASTSAVGSCSAIVRAGEWVKTATSGSPTGFSSYFIPLGKID